MITLNEKKKWTLFRHQSMLLLLLTAWLMSMHITTISGADHPELKAFPAAKEGMQRFVIVLPHKERGTEDAFKVEIIPGKTMLTDGVNLVRLGTTIEPRTLKGWGYTYYEITGQDVAMSTMMAPPDAEPQRETFVQGTSLLIRYNSRLPIVIYAPQGYEIRYRIWETSEITKKSEQG
jgi:ecotin